MKESKFLKVRGELRSGEAAPRCGLKLALKPTAYTNRFSIT